MFYFCHVLNTLFIHIQTSLNLDNMAKQNNCVKNSFKSFFFCSEQDGSGEESEEENEVLEESPCGRWRKLRSKVINGS